MAGGTNCLRESPVALVLIAPTVPSQDPQAAAEEVRRVGRHTQVAAISLPLVNIQMGNRWYWPIYAAAEAMDQSDRQLALRRCLEKVPRHSRRLLWQRYGAEKSIRQIAAESQRSEDSVKSLFLRLRKSLERCVEADLKWNAK